MPSIRLICLFFSCMSFFGSCLYAQLYVSAYATGGTLFNGDVSGMSIGKDGYIYVANVIREDFPFEIGAETVSTGMTGAIVVSKFTMNCEAVWTKKIFESHSQQGYRPYTSIATDSAGNIALQVTYGGTLSWTGNQIPEDSLSNTELFLLDASGAINWHHPMGNALWYPARGVCFDDEGSVLATGRDNNHIYLRKYTSGGTLSWEKLVGIGEENSGIIVETAADHSIYAAGIIHPSGSVNFDGLHPNWPPGNASHASYLVKYNSEGTAQWVRSMYASQWDKYANIICVTPLSNGNVAVGGTYDCSPLYFTGGSSAIGTNEMYTYSSFVAVFDADGNRLWAKKLHTGSPSQPELIYDLAEYGTGQLMAFSNISGTVTIGGNTVNGNAQNQLVELLDESGNVSSYKVIGSDAADHGYEAARTPNAIYLLTQAAGSFFSLGNSTFTLGSGQSLNLIQISGLLGTEEAGFNELSVYPNPAAQTITLSLKTESPFELQLFDVYGKAVLESNSSGQSIQLDLSALAAGIYTLIVQQNGNRLARKIVKE